MNDSASSSLMMIAIFGFLWLMWVLLQDYGPITIVLFFTGIGAFILAFMTLLDIRRTWQPLVVTFGSLMLGLLFYSP